MRTTTIKLEQLKYEWREEVYALAKKWGIDRNDPFLKLLPFDLFLSLIKNKPDLDVVIFDEILAQNDPEYIPDECRWKDKEGISMREYIRQKFGENYCNFVEELLKK
jgi:hypothetical protein